MTLPANAIDRLIEKVQHNVGRPGDSILADYTIEWINKGQTRVCNKANFWFMRASTTLSFAQGDLTKALPSDFKDEDGVWLLDAATNRWTEIDYMEYTDYRRQYDDTTQQQPVNYVLDGSGNILLRPVPDKAYSVVLDYWKYLADVVSGGASNDLIDDYPDVLESYATWKAFFNFSEFESAEKWERKFDLSLADLVVANAERELPDEMVLRIRPDVHGTGIGRIKNRG